MAVLNDQLLDDHWRPILDLCSVRQIQTQIVTMIVHDNHNDGHHCDVDIEQVCGIEYDFLIKFEHLSREEEYLRERLLLQDVIGPR